VSLFVHFDAEGRVTPIGTRATQEALAPHLRLTADAGRHYFFTAFVRRGIDDRVIDVAGRHAEAPCESMTSTSLFALRQAWAIVNSAQMDELARLRVKPLTGLSRQ
jgi:hypothetical protein